MRRRSGDAAFKGDMLMSYEYELMNWVALFWTASNAVIRYAWYRLQMRDTYSSFGLISDLLRVIQHKVGRVGGRVLENRAFRSMLKLC